MAVGRIEIFLYLIRNAKRGRCMAGGVVMGEKSLGRFESYTIYRVSASGTVKVYPE